MVTTIHAMQLHTRANYTAFPYPFAANVPLRIGPRRFSALRNDVYYENPPLQGGKYWSRPLRQSMLSATWMGLYVSVWLRRDLRVEKKNELK